MFQQETFDGDRIDLELGWAEWACGINTLRVFLHEMLWEKDSGGFNSRVGKLLKLADKHKMRVILVLFDSFGDPYPELGRQRQPKQGVRDSVWAQSPGAKGLVDPVQTERSLSYVKEVVNYFSIDKRILAWDVWNEPEMVNGSTYGMTEPPNKVALVTALLPKVFQYARAGQPTQPLTSGLWKGDWSSMASLSPIEKTQVELSDFISFQNYDGPQEFEKRVKWLKAFGRPVICTGFLARNQGSSVEAILPIALKYDVGALIGDLVQGKTMRFLPWDSWQTPYVGREPSVWSQDLFFSTGPLYQPKRRRCDQADDRPISQGGHYQTRIEEKREIGKEVGQGDRLRTWGPPYRNIDAGQPRPVSAALMTISASRSRFNWRYMAAEFRCARQS